MVGKMVSLMEIIEADQMVSKMVDLLELQMDNVKVEKKVGKKGNSKAELMDK